MTGTIQQIHEIGCIIMASGLSVRYGKNKLLEKLDGRELILHTAENLIRAGFKPLVVTRSSEVITLAEREGISYVIHSGSRKCDTMHTGIENTRKDATGYLFMPGDQPLVRPASLQRMAEHFFSCPERAVRLGFNRNPGSPVLFPASCREDLLAYTGDRGGMDVIRSRQIPCDIVQAENVWELWDADTPEKMKMIEEAYFSSVHC